MPKFIYFRVAQFIAVFKNIKVRLVFEICAVKNAELNGGSLWRSEDFFSEGGLAPSNGDVKFVAVVIIFLNLIIFRYCTSLRFQRKYIKFRKH